VINVLSYFALLFSLKDIVTMYGDGLEWLVYIKTLIDIWAFMTFSWEH